MRTEEQIMRYYNEWIRLKLDKVSSFKEYKEWKVNKRMV